MYPSTFSLFFVFFVFPGVELLELLVYFGD